MKTRNLFFALVVGLALATAPIVGCGDDTTDPSNNANNTKQDVGGDKTDVGGDKTDVGGDKTDVGGNTDTGGGTDTSTPVEECEGNTTFFGQVGGDKAPNGGTWTTDKTELKDDAGIQAVLDAVPNVPGKDRVQQDHTASPLEIRGATIIATFAKDASKGVFWVQDQKAGLRIRLSKADNVSEIVRVGQIVDFDITGTQNFEGHIQVEKLTNFTIVEQTSAVPYTDLTGNDISADLYNTNVRVDGQLVGEGNPCGGSETNPSICYNLVHGDKTVEFRSASQFLKTGACVTFFGPLNINPGPSRDDVTEPKVQLDTTNYDWYYETFK